MANKPPAPFTRSQWTELRILERAMRTWAERECNGYIQEDGDGIPRRYYQDTYGCPTIPGPKIRNRYASALSRAKEIAAVHGFKVYDYSDPRGPVLHLYTEEMLDGLDIESALSSHALAVC